MATDQFLTISLQDIPNEIIRHCFDLLSPEYCYWDLWHIGLVSKLFLEQIKHTSAYYKREIGKLIFIFEIF